MKKELATKRVWLFPSTHRKLMVLAAQNGQTIAEVVQDLSNKGKYPLKASKKKTFALLKKAIKPAQE